MKARFADLIEVAVLALVGQCAMAADIPQTPPSALPPVVKNGTIGYVLTGRHWAVYQTEDGKAECPNGFNDGPREQFKTLFPNDGTKRTLLDTQLLREGRQWHPSASPENLMFQEAGGTVSYGMNLDGKVTDSDFTGPHGEKGIDNQLFRAIGCIEGYRTRDGDDEEWLHRYSYNRLLLEITGVDSLVNDDDVTVKTYRGLDDLVTDATGSSFIPGGTQHVDDRWVKFAQATFKGRIVNGVLTTEPGEMILPASGSFGTTGVYKFKGFRLQLNLTAERAEGLMAGYTDVEEFIHQLNTTESTHIQSYGRISSPSLYRAMRRLADGYPDPKTGQMTAISSALLVKFTQVYIVKPTQRQATQH